MSIQRMHISLHILIHFSLKSHESNNTTTTDLNFAFGKQKQWEFLTSSSTFVLMLSTFARNLEKSKLGTIQGWKVLEKNHFVSHQLRRSRFHVRWLKSVKQLFFTAEISGELKLKTIRNLKRSVMKHSQDHQLKTL